MYSDQLIDKFCSCISRIMSEGEGSWQEKRDALEAAIEERGETANFEELLSWFANDSK